jgi:hypothetical protein
MFQIALSLFILLSAFLVMPVHSQDREVFLLEDFNNFENWTPYTFPKIKDHTAYSIYKEGNHSYLKAESSSSASGIVYKNIFRCISVPEDEMALVGFQRLQKGQRQNKIRG